MLEHQANLLLKAGRTRHICSVALVILDVLCTAGRILNIAAVLCKTGALCAGLKWHTTIEDIGEDGACIKVLERKAVPALSALELGCMGKGRNDR